MFRQALSTITEDLGSRGRVFLVACRAFCCASPRRLGVACPCVASVRPFEREVAAQPCHVSGGGAGWG